MPETTPDAPVPLKDCDHEWREGYYGLTCVKCGQQHIYGCEPWSPLVDESGNES